MALRAGPANLKAEVAPFTCPRHLPACLPPRLRWPWPGRQFRDGVMESSSHGLRMKQGSHRQRDRQVPTCGSHLRRLLCSLPRRARAARFRPLARIRPLAVPRHCASALDHPPWRGHLDARFPRGMQGFLLHRLFAETGPRTAGRGCRRAWRHCCWCSLPRGRPVPARHPVVLRRHAARRSTLALRGDVARFRVGEQRLPQRQEALPSCSTNIPLRSARTGRCPWRGV